MIKNTDNLESISPKLIRAYALENAVKYKGKANQGAVLAGLFSEGLEKSQVKEIMPTIQKVIQEVNSLSLESQEKFLEQSESKTSKREIREGLKPLPNAKKGKVAMRMAPFPSGPLHIGNARTMILNDEYCKMYDGKLIIVMDDTIGGQAKQIEPEAYKLIVEGIDWLGINHDKTIVYKSDRTAKYYEYAEEMLKKGYLYVCECDQETMHDLKLKGIECSCRKLPSEEQMSRWKEMFKAKMGSMTVRLKTSMSDPDPAFRDRVMFKISDRPHARTGTKFRIYPSMEFSWAIDDHVLGITHVLRGTEHHMSTRVQDFIRNIFNWPNPESIYNGLFAVEGIKISKSGGRAKVKSGEYSGWNDPRLWSLQSLRDRGITKEAIREFLLGMGIKKTNVKIPIETLYTLNKKHLEKVPRYFFVENPQKIKINGCPPLVAKLPLHPSEDIGTRNYKTSQEFLISQEDAENMQDANYRLMHLLNFKSDRIQATKPRTYSFISEDPLPTPNSKLQTTERQRVKYIHWIPASPNNVKVEIIMPDGSIKKGLGEPDLYNLLTGSTIQFERFGFVKLMQKEKDKLQFWFTHN